jgi:hypothetical protein
MNFTPWIVGAVSLCSLAVLLLEVRAVQARQALAKVERRPLFRRHRPF